MNLFKLVGTVPALALVTSMGMGMSTEAQASSLLYSETHDYGSDAGKVDPSGNDTLGADFVTVSDQSSGRFSDLFTFGTGLGTIDRIDVTLDFAQAGPSKGLFGCFLGECWDARLQGSNSSGTADDVFEGIADVLSPQTISLSAATDTGSVDTFSHSVTSGTLGLWFAEKTLGGENFDLDSAQVEVFGTVAPVPVPAALPLLLAGLGGLGLVARRKRKAA